MSEDLIVKAIALLDAEAPKKNVTWQPDQGDPRKRVYNVPTLEGRKQLVQVLGVPDSLFGERLEMLSIAVRELPAEPGLLVGLLALARNFRRARFCTFDAQHPELTVAASFVPEEIHDMAGPRLLHALREVASIADSIENQISGVDIE
jgi:hypothetical protein